MKIYLQCVRESFKMGQAHSRKRWPWRTIWDEWKEVACSFIDISCIPVFKFISPVLSLYGGYKIYRRQKCVSTSTEAKAFGPR